MATKEQYDKFKDFLMQWVGLIIDQIEACPEGDYFKTKGPCDASKCQFPIHETWPHPYYHLFKYTVKKERPTTAVWREMYVAPEHVSVFTLERLEKGE